MSKPDHPVLVFLDELIDGMDWRDVLSVRRSINDYLGHQADIRQAADTTSTESEIPA